MTFRSRIPAALEIRPRLSRYAQEWRCRDSAEILGLTSKDDNKNKKSKDDNKNKKSKDDNFLGLLAVVTG